MLFYPKNVFLAGVALLFLSFADSLLAAPYSIEEKKNDSGHLVSAVVNLMDGVLLEMNFIPGGSYACFENRKPLAGEETDTEGRIIHSFSEDSLAFGKYEITQAQWQAVMGTTQEQLRDKGNPGGRLFGLGDDYPVYYVGWNDAQAFCKKLNDKVFQGRGDFEFALPSVPEWEYACRAGTDTQLNNGKNMVLRKQRDGNQQTNKVISRELDEVAWYAGNSENSVNPVGRKMPNRWGLYDMHGNVDELTEDWIDEAFPGLDLCARMGGSWHAQPYSCTSTGTYRQNIMNSGSDDFDPTDHFHEPIMCNTASFTTGFRVVLRKKTSVSVRKKYETKTLHPQKINGLTMLMCFLDDQERQIVKEKEVDSFLNDLDYKGNNNTCSVAGYVYDQSRGRCLLHFDIVGYFFAQNYRANYKAGARHSGGERLIREAVTWLDQNADYSKYSHNNAGLIRAFMTLYSGNSSFDGLWPCMMWLWGNNQVWLPGRTIHANECLLCGIGERPQVSILVHETMHAVFGLGDYVDYGEQSSKTPRGQQKASHGLGNHCIMGIGMYDPKTGRQNNPSALCGVFRYRLGWMTVLPLPSSGKVRIPGNGNYAYCYRNPENPYEYFLLENRNSGSTFDNVLPSHGLAVWHVDDAETDKSENEEMTESRHYEISLEQAHGKFLLEQADCGPFSNFHHKRDCNGTADDYFYPPKYTKFGDSTIPNSKWWNGASSGLEITNIEVDGRDLILTIGKNSAYPH